jgi:hypothetical protein
MMIEPMGNFGDLTELIRDPLRACIDRGMQPPLILCAACANGSVLCVRTDGISPELLAEHYEPAGFRVPITLLVLDQTSEVAIITIDAERRMVVH